jgi:hypothetical protein
VQLNFFSNNPTIEPQGELLETWQAHYAWRTAPPAGPEVLKLLTKSLPESFSAPAPGQLWLLKNELDGPDEDGLYLNMPMVLIISASNLKFEVMQTAPFSDLMGPTDIYLSDDDGFVEPWNRFTLPPKALKEYRGKLEPGLLERIKTANPWRPISSGLDWEEAFWRLERQVAEAARQRAAVWQYASASSPSKIETIWNNPRQLAVELIPPSTTWRLPLAAASKESVGISFRTPDGWKLGVANITGVIEENGWVTLKGELKAPGNYSMDAFFALVKQEGGEANLPEKIQFTPPFFELEFASVESFNPNQLQLLVISYGA